MADTKISAMTAATVVNDADVAPIVQSGANKRAPFSVWKSSLKSYFDTVYATSGGQSSSLTAGCTTANCNMVFEGDSQMAPDLSGHTDVPYQVMLTREFAGRGNAYNFAVGGNKILDLVNRYTASVYPLRPTGSITKSFLTVLIGINDLLLDDGATVFAAWESYINTAIADGFTIIAISLNDRLDGFIGPLTRPGVVIFNRLLRASTLWTALVEQNLLFPDMADTTWTDGATHLNAAGKYQLARYINNIAAAGGALNITPLSVAAEGPRETALGDGATILWNMNPEQSAYVSIAGNRTLAAPSGYRNGPIYMLKVKGNGHTLAFDTAYKFNGGSAPVLDTGTNKIDIFTFTAHGDDILNLTHVVNELTPVSGGDIINDGFSGSGDLDGSTPDTADIPGSVWVSRSGGIVRSGGQAFTSNSACVTIDAASADVSVQALTLYGGAAITGIILRATDEHNFIGMFLTSGSDWIIYKYVASSFTPLGSGSFTPSGSGDTLKIRGSGSTITGFVNGTLVATVTETFNQTATGVGLETLGSGSAGWDNFRVF